MRNARSHTLIDQDYRELDGLGLRVAIRDKNGVPVTSPVYLRNGKEMTDQEFMDNGEQPDYLNFRVLKELPFAALGLPATI